MRFALTMSFLVVIYWAWGIANDYLFGDIGLNFDLFIHGIIKVGFAAVLGFVFVSACVFFVTTRRKQKNAFESVIIDEYGTEFNWPIMLSKFLPEVIAAPLHINMHPLEQELLGFLNGYREWPQDINDPSAGSLADAAINRWRAVHKLHNVTELHRIVALALDLGKVLSYAEKRSYAPWHKPWRRDKVNYVNKAAVHGGFSAFVLSTFDTFRRLDENTRQTLLLAVRFGRDPLRIPSNSPAIVQEIYSAVHRAEAADSTAKDATISPESLSTLEQHLSTYAQGMLGQIPLTNTNANNPAGVYVGGREAILVVSLPHFLQIFAGCLTPDMREKLDLWELKTTVQPTWELVTNKFRGLNALLEEWDGDTAENGLFSLSFAGKIWPHCMVIAATPEKMPMLYKQLNKLPAAPHQPEPAEDDASLLADIKAKALSIDGLLG